jgi:hypothetical protein
MHSLSSSLRRAVGVVATRLHSAAALSSASLARNTAAPAAAAAAFAQQPSRSTSSLPVIDEYVRRSYPFPTILESDMPADYSKYLFYHNQYPTDLPRYKSKLTVDIRDLGLNPTSRMVMREIVGSRYNPTTHQIAFVSRHLPTALANENRVFQQLDACLVEAREIAKKMNADGVFGPENGARHNRLLTPKPKREVVEKELIEQRKRKIDALRTKAGMQPIHAVKAEDKPASSSTAAAVDLKPRASRNARNAQALGMTDEQRRALAQPTKSQLLDEIIRSQQPAATA